MKSFIAVLFLSFFVVIMAAETDKVQKIDETQEVAADYVARDKRGAVLSAYSPLAYTAYSPIVYSSYSLPYAYSYGYPYYRYPYYSSSYIVG